MAGPSAAGGSALGKLGVGADRGEGAGAKGRGVAWQAVTGGGLFEIEGGVYTGHDLMEFTECLAGEKIV